MERIIAFEPAYDHRHADPDKNGGIHGVTLRFLVKGAEGAAQFVLYTNWQLPHVQAEFDQRPLELPRPHSLCRPAPADLGYHSPRPMFEGHEAVGAFDYEFGVGDEIAPGLRAPKVIPTGTFTPCEYLDGRPCYYDGSSLAAEGVFQRLLSEGDAGVWAALEEYYERTFAAKALS